MEDLGNAMIKAHSSAHPSINLFKHLKTMLYYTMAWCGACNIQNGLVRCLQHTEWLLLSGVVASCVVGCSSVPVNLKLSLEMNQKVLKKFHFCLSGLLRSVLHRFRKQYDQ